MHDDGRSDPEQLPFAFLEAPAADAEAEAAQAADAAGAEPEQLPFSFYAAMVARDASAHGRSAAHARSEGVWPAASPLVALYARARRAGRRTRRKAAG